METDETYFSDRLWNEIWSSWTN